MKHLPNLKDFSKKEILDLINLALDIKKNPKNYEDKLKGKSMAMWFEKPSLRTRVSFEACMTQLGGHAIYLDPKKTHAKADIKDEIACLARYVDIIIARVFDHRTIKNMVDSSRVPVINALCDKYHPCQALADIMTVFENSDNPLKSSIAYVGDGNNVCNSLIEISKKLGINIIAATPKDLKPILKPNLWSSDPESIVGADFIYTDTWVSMGQEKEKDVKIKKLKSYQVTKKILGNSYFMHCLPANRNQEVTSEVLDSKKSLVFDQAENRLHINKALVLTLLRIK